MSTDTTTEKLGRLDLYGDLRATLLPLCRLSYGEIWEDSERGHRVGVIDGTKKEDVLRLIDGQTSSCLICDPPYNVGVGKAKTDSLFKISPETYIAFSRKWIENILLCTKDSAHFYIWTGLDVNDNFQPLPELLLLLREFTQLRPRNFITLRNQRGYGTQRNWMWVRQELLHYIKGDPAFNVCYTDIPKVLKGYYKVVGGKRTENLERSKANTIRPGNVWIDIQQVFYRMEENVAGCYAQKPLEAIERIMLSSSVECDAVIDLFAHSGTTLIAGERNRRRVFTADIDPVFAEITIRRLENLRSTGKTGWQWRNPFPEIGNPDDDEKTADNENGADGKKPMFRQQDLFQP
ncbi:MAG: site-specific DNA-methyltransferase [Spirochaetales bacterium]|nr:site-specific DNA-methyltransferase [Spirochaetales bacterium]